MRGRASFEDMGVWDAIFVLPYLVLATVAVVLIGFALAVEGAQVMLRLVRHAATFLRRPAVQFALATAWIIGVLGTAMLDRSIPSLREGCDQLRGFEIVATGAMLGDADVQQCEARRRQVLIHLWTTVLLPLGLAMIWNSWRQRRERPRD